MTNLPANQPANRPAIPDSDLPDGLEDTDASDLTTPIYRIDHESGVFVNGLTNEQMQSFDVILLGRIKQRILWPMDVGGDGEAPMCRSYDFTRGIPRPETWVQPQKNNPALTAVKISGWDYSQVEDAAGGEGLACANCALKDWGADRTPPWCNEQWTFPFLSLDEDGQPLAPGVISFQRTGLKPCKTYVSGFVQAKSALYTVVTRLTAVLQQRGSVKWVTPSFQRLRDSDPTQWNDYSQALHSIKEFLTTPRTFNNDPDAEAVETATVATTTVSKPAAARTVVPASESESPAPAPEPPIVVPPVTEKEAPPVKRVQPEPATVPSPPAGGTVDFEEEEPFMKLGDRDFSFRNMHFEL
jgi:hypothetical protein